MVTRTKTKTPAFVHEVKAFDLQDFLEVCLGVGAFMMAALVNPQTWVVADRVPMAIVGGAVLLEFAVGVLYLFLVLYQEYEFKDSLLTAIARLCIVFIGTTMVITLAMFASGNLSVGITTTAFLKRILAGQAGAMPAGLAFNLLMKK